MALRTALYLRHSTDKSKTENQLVIDDATETVHVHAIWGAPKGRTPKL